MTKTFTTEDFAKWGRIGAAITNSNYSSEKRRKAAKKAWANRRNKALQKSK